MLRCVIFSAGLVAVASTAVGNDVLALNFKGEAEAVVIDSGTTGVLSRRHIHDFAQHDLAWDPAGVLYVVGGGDTIFYGDPATDDVFARLGEQDADDIAYSATHGLVVLDTVRDSDPSAALISISPTGSPTDIDRPLDYILMGMDIPKSGPYENDIIAYARDLTGTYWLFRYRSQADGSYQREGPFGPLAFMNWNDCRPRGAFHLAARWNDHSWVAVERCSRRVLEFDYEGNFLGVFATHPPDHSVDDPVIPGRPHDDNMHNVHVTPDDHVWVATGAHVYHHAPDGALLGVADYVFTEATAITDAAYVPFETIGVSCEPKGIGYWKRQCLGEGEGGGPGRNGRGRGFARVPGQLMGPGVHPTMRDGRLPSLIERVDERLESQGVTACEALWPSDPSSQRSKALRAYAAVLFNLEDRHLGRRCVVTMDGAPRELRDVLPEVEALLALGAEDADREAARLAHGILGG